VHALVAGNLQHRLNASKPQHRHLVPGSRSPPAVARFFKKLRIWVHDPLNGCQPTVCRTPHC